MDCSERAFGVHAAIETAAPGERRAAKWAALTRLVATAFERSGEFRTRLAGAGMTPGDVRTPEDFARIPVLRKKDLIALQASGDALGGLLAMEFGELRRIYQSPGPIFDPEGRGEDYWGWAEAFYAAGFRSGDVVQMTFSYHMTPAGLMLEEPLQALGCAVIPAGPGNTAAQIELLTKLPVTGFVGMTSYLDVIGTKAREMGLDLRRDFRLKVAFVAAERLPETLRRKVQDDFGMVVRQGYGTADVGCVAYECRELTGLHVSSRGWLEIRDPATGAVLAPGEIGEVVFTPFTDAYPLIRLATGDLSRLIDEPCPCGRTSMRLEGILGRVDDTAKVKGQFIYPSQAAEVCQGFPVITAWQVVVDNPGGRDALEIRLCCGGELDAAAFAAKFQERLKLRPKVTLLGPGEAIEEGAPRLVDRRRFD